MHKESLNKSDAERKVLDDVRAKAPLQQKRRTDAIAAAAAAASRKAAVDSSDKTSSSSSSPLAPVTSPLKHSASSPDRVKAVVILIKISVQLHACMYAHVEWFVSSLIDCIACHHPEAWLPHAQRPIPF